jgi:hypothetical protein
MPSAPQGRKPEGSAPDETACAHLMINRIKTGTPYRLGREYASNTEMRIDIYELGI